MQETVLGIHWPRNHKLPGTDRITAKLIKYMIINHTKGFISIDGEGLLRRMKQRGLSLPYIIGEISQSAPIIESSRC